MRTGEGLVELVLGGNGEKLKLIAKGGTRKTASEMTTSL